MKVAQLVTTLACMLALGGCLTLPETLADSDASVGDHAGSDGPVSAGHGGSAGETFGAGGVGGEEFGAAGGGAFGAAGGGSEAFGTGGNPASVDPNLSDGGVALACLDGTSNPCTAGTATDAGFGAGGSEPTASDASVGWSDLQLGTRSSGCEQLASTDLCMGEGWMLAEGESIPDCGESGAYRICTFETDACVSHTVMMVQRCD